MNNLTGFAQKKISFCKSQEIRLGLWFSIAVGCTRAVMAMFGPINRALGTRSTRVLILYELFLRFATL